MFVCLVKTIFDMIFTKVHIIIGSFVMIFVITNNSAEGFVELDIYTSIARGYKGVPHDIICEVNSGNVTGNVEFTRPGKNKLVLQCDNQFTSKSCKTVVDGYTLKIRTSSSYTMAIESFNPDVDEGVWTCHDSNDDASISSVEIVSASIFKVTDNELPTQKNDSDGYYMRVAGACTFPVPVCKWKIMEVGESFLNELEIPSAYIDQKMKPCKNDLKVTCIVKFDKTPEVFLEKYLIFSVTISHPSIPGNPITPDASPVLFFPLPSIPSVEPYHPDHPVTPFSPDDPDHSHHPLPALNPSDPENTTGVDGTTVAMVIIALIIAGVVPVACLINKRRKTQKDQKQLMDKDSDPYVINVYGDPDKENKTDDIGHEVSINNELDDNMLDDNMLDDNKLDDNTLDDNTLDDNKLDDNKLDLENQTVQVKNPAQIDTKTTVEVKTQNKVDDPSSSEPTKIIMNDSDGFAWM
ncbi:uncharacterized protein LOC121386609 isoform X2 [Gigantopelta aegis]|uniref:uncharacterized protein LOC121386609 isoform X2 n=1 Tax=Gigantopelta aegis TaxID=1735272 RepID=UPI001B887483|nr:uncharacterized protein LOC121386609 isoform X2 [Gigantopelta aegis]